MKTVMRSRRVLPQLLALASLAGGVLLAAAPGANAYPAPPSEPGAPLPGLSQSLLAEFQDGQALFQHPMSLSEGLGPIYNDTSCIGCHGTVGGIPGGGDRLGTTSTHNVTHIGLDNQGFYDPLRYEGGPLLEAHTIRDDGTSCTLGPSVVPANANILSIRHTPPVFGFGLVDAIPDAEILRYSNLGVDGVHGFANWANEMQAVDTPTANFPPDSIYGHPRVGRFGWKAQVGTLQQFSAEPLTGELGVTNLFFPQEHSPAGVKDPSALPTGCELANTNPNDPDQTKAFELYHFQALLGPPPRAYSTPASREGEEIFRAIGCENCHVSEMRTGPRYYMLNVDGSSTRVPQLENQDVHAYSDFLVHDMGPELADNGGTTVGRVMGRARGQHWRTTPLWGFRFKDAYLHDGRTDDAKAAILAHGGEGAHSRDRFSNLSSSAQDAVVAFLNTL